MNHIFTQILLLLTIFSISQHHAKAQENPFLELKCGDVFTRVCKESLYRTMDASCNNKLHPTWGMTYTRYARLVRANYDDGFYSPRKSKKGNPLPLARVLSRVLSPDKKILDKKYSGLALQWTQVVTHDLLLTDSRQDTPETNCCSKEGKIIRDPAKHPLCYPVLVPKDDPNFGPSGIRCFNFFIRKQSDVDRKCSARDGTANQLCITTHYIDLSLVYGSTDEEASSLREFKGGRLLADIRKNQEWPPKGNTCVKEAEVCYRTGDNRTNLRIQLAIFVVALFREHNRIARELSKLNPHWNDEKIYQEARRIYIAMAQQVTYYELMPIILGEENSLQSGLTYNTKDYINDYDSNVDASTLNEVGAAVLRSFHTSLAGDYNMVNENRDPAHGTANINKLFNNPTVIEQNDNYDSLMRGLATQPQEAYDQYYNDELTVKLRFGADVVRTDLRALDIHRGREHGLGTYNQYRKYCGFREAKTWNEFLDFIPLKDVIDMENIYESPDDVDLTVGASVERPVPGALVGPTYLCILDEQFYRTRVGDRFFFENGITGYPFTLDQLNEIRKYTISRLICDNTDTKSMQRRGLELISKENPLVSCKLIPRINLSLWKE